MKRVLMLAYYFPPSKAAGTFRTQHGVITVARMRRPSNPASAQPKYFAVAGPLPKGRALTTVDRPDTGPADVSENQPPYTGAAGRRGDVPHAGVSTGTTGEPDRPVPPGRIGEHEIGSGRPLGEHPELGCPRSPLPDGLDEITNSRVRSVLHR